MERDGGFGIRRTAWGALLASLFLLWPGSEPCAGQEAQSQRPSPPFLSADAGALKRSVRKTPLAEGIRVAYEWRDFMGEIRRFDVSLSNSALVESEKAFGFSTDELRQFLIAAESGIRADMGLSAADIARKVVSAKADPSWCRVTEDPASDFQYILRTDGTGRDNHSAEIEGIIRESTKVWESSQKKISGRLERAGKEFLRSRGMVMTPGGIAVDYRALVCENRDRLAPLAAEFKKICGQNLKKRLEAVLSFVQAIPFHPRPTVEHEKYSAGLAVPLRVLSDDSGDCDSKAVLFAALWTGLCRYRTILITVPEHMLVGVAVPFISGATIEIDSTRYVLLEVNCGTSLQPGEITSLSLDSVRKGQMKYRIVS
jgi:hypothetical protein